MVKESANLAHGAAFTISRFKLVLFLQDWDESQLLFQKASKLVQNTVLLQLQSGLLETVMKGGFSSFP